mmetsp:Transcript_113854/g.226575  ORF Transcript_113854/g.226575 Transcript_113854/m.226575 type:complete len:597 (+) Transcript_113854:174-1964(+)
MIFQGPGRCVGCSPNIAQDDEEHDSVSCWTPLQSSAGESVTQDSWLQVGDEVEAGMINLRMKSKRMPLVVLHRSSSTSVGTCSENISCASGCTYEGALCQHDQDSKADNSQSPPFPDIPCMVAAQKRSQSSPNVQTLYTQELQQGSTEAILCDSQFGIPNEAMSVNCVRASAKSSVSMESLSYVHKCETWVHARLPSRPPPAERLAADDFLAACGGCADFSDEAFTTEQLRVCIDEVRECIKPWKPGQLIRMLHSNPHTRTKVDLVRFSGSMPSKVVVKRMPNDWIEANQEEFERLHPHEREHPWHDLGILRHLNEIGYPFVCKLLWVFRDEDNTYVTSSLASEGDLHSWCRHLSRPSLSREGQLQPVARQVFSAVRWLHELGIAHRDLSLENVLLHRCYGSGSVNCEVCAGRECGLCCRCGRGVHVKLCDFAMCSMERSCTDGVRGKRSYQAPEMHLEETAYDPFLADAFALGVLLYAAAAQDYPWNSTVPEAGCDRFRYAQSVGFRKYLQLKRLRKTGPTMMQVFSEPLVTLLEGLMQMEPEKRLILGESCFMHALKETKQPEKTDTSVGANEVATVWATRWLNETYRANCFGC